MKFLLVFIFLSTFLLAQDVFIAQKHLYGYTQGQYGEKDCNPSVENLLAAVENLNTKENFGQKFSFDNNVSGIPYVGIKTHAQGIARIPGIENENWFVFTKSGYASKDAGLIFARFARLQSSGNAWANAKSKQPQWNYGKSQLFFSDTTHNQDHPGGIQVLGQTLVVGSDGKDGTQVDFYDIGNPYRVQHLNRLKIDGSQQERHIGPGGKGARAHFVSAAKLKDGRYLLFVARHTRVIFKDPEPGKGWIYISDSKQINQKTHWKYISFCSYFPKGNAYQSANLLTEKPSGNLYLAMMGPEGFLQKNYLDLWQLKAHPNPKLPDDAVFLKLVKSKIVWSCIDGGTFDAGGGIHISPKGKLVLYMIDRWQSIFNNHINLEEYCQKNKENSKRPGRLESKFSTEAGVKK